MASLWHLRGLTFWELVKRVWHEIVDDDVFGHAAQLSYYFIFALFPLLLLLTTIFGYFAQSADMRASLLDYFGKVVPGSAYSLVVDTLDQITRSTGGGKLSIGLVMTLWAASAGMEALSDGLNTAYEIKDERPWWRSRLVAIGLTIAFAVFIVVALALIVAGANIGALVAAHVGLQTAFAVVWNIARWAVAIFFVLVAVNLLYRYAPDLYRRHWRWITPGALVAVFVWLLVSLGFRFYLRYFFNSYNATYGSLGAVIILLLWLYITGAAILIGAEVDSEIENAAAEAGDPGSRLAGEKRPGERRDRMQRPPYSPPAPATGD